MAALPLRTTEPAAIGIGAAGLLSLRILIADKNLMWCHFLSGALQREPDFTVVSTVGESEALLESLRRQRPDVLIVCDLLLQSPSLLQCLLEIRRTCPNTKTVVVSDTLETQSVVDVFRGGARGVFRRSEGDPKVLSKCINRVAEGQIWATNEQVSAVIDSFIRATWVSPPLKAGAMLLTPGERNVVRLVAQGLSNREIAKELGLSFHTVKNYMFRIFDKLGLSSRVELALYVVTHLMQV